jgi:hypothetical protein
MVLTDEERRAQQREHYQKNKEKLKADSKKRYLKDHEKNIQNDIMQKCFNCN